MSRSKRKDTSIAVEEAAERVIWPMPGASILALSIAVSSTTECLWRAGLPEREARRDGSKAYRAREAHKYSLETKILYL